MKKIITIFGSSRDKENSPEYQFAYELGISLAKNGYSICNGGYGGSMEASARGALDAGGNTIGITVDLFNSKVNKYIREDIKAVTLFERIEKLIDTGDAFIVLKGGTGTLLEIAAVWELIHKNLIDEKPIIAISPFWEPMVNQFKVEMAWEGMGDCTKFIKLSGSLTEIINFLNDWFKNPSKGLGQK
jgi:uncharacterized protein (TIGR00725 family)